MRFRNLLVIAVIVVLASCQGNNSVKITGKISGGEDVSMTLIKRDVSTSVVVDSIKMNASGDFQFKLPLIEPGFYMLQIAGKSPVTLLLTPGEKIVFTADANSFDRAYNVEGSVGSAQVKDIYLRLVRLKDQIDSLSNKSKELLGNQQALLGIYSTIDSLISGHKEYSISFLRNNVNSIATVFVLYQQVADDAPLFDPIDDIVYYRMVASSLRAFHPEMMLSKTVVANYQDVDQRIRTAKVNQIIANAEATLPDIALPNVKGDTIKLSSFKGKVVVLDFWSSASSNALLDNREMVEIYNEFKGKGLVVYQVSVDEDGRAWSNAIKNAGIPFYSVRDQNGPNSLAVRIYNVQKVPSNYIIGKNYDIVGKDLYGNNLRKKLKAILG
ncbi:TlpA disulfide reductase family protein [Williamwhitmania taraxaci]|uniref:Peroxiredoxin n=1 Tax=Williamwhitmania taraxaci TaxID=1640674 RepID=A0A1G6PID9_9BACT|nr:TlpA disulfide reductase family protein [Williamwhitmania taraxaci]SDC79818.1 Peroxiredoxin [Williamwhitmania taraxaci]